MTSHVRSTSAESATRFCGIFEDREIDAGLLDELGDVGLGFVGVGVDAENHDALLGELAIELDEPGHVEIRHRAVVAEEDEHDRLCGPESRRA